MQSDSLSELRKKIDKIDAKLVAIIRERFITVRLIGVLKKDRNLTPLDTKRWQRVLTSRKQWASQQGLDPILIEHIFEIIHYYSLQVEEQT